MKEASRTCTLMMSEDSRSATSLPGSGCGHTPLDKQGGMTTEQYGQEVAHANLSPRQANQMGLLTSGTFGLRSSISSRSANLTSCLVNRLKQQLSTLGSTLYKLTWKELVTPQGRSVSLLRASVLRTSEAGCTGWPTPKVSDTKMPIKPAAIERWLSRPNHGSELSIIAYQVAGWATPTSQDAVRGVKPPRPQDTGIPLTQQVGQMDFGKMPTGYPSEIPSSVRLNPALSRWLMGVPREWASCAPMATP